MKSILVTGATGFVGKALCGHLLAKGYRVTGTARPGRPLFDGVCRIEIEDISTFDWQGHLDGLDCVVHLAARAHVLRETAQDPDELFREVNATGTERLAQAAAKAGVKRMVFLSSIGVNGDSTGAAPFNEADSPNPRCSYANSKLEAETVLRSIGEREGMKFVIIRSPLVYGPENPGNFLRLIKLVDRGWPLPLASVSNKRSFIFLDNLVSAIAVCLEHPDAIGKTFLVSDGEDLSTPELIRRLADAMGRPARLFPFPPRLLLFLGGLFGRRKTIERLCGSLQIDSTRIQEELSWTPVVSIGEGLRKTTDWYTLTLPSRL